MNKSQASPKFRPGLVTIVIPAKDEEAAIGPTLRSLPRATLRAMGFEVEVVILDGQSRDRTRDIIYEHGDATVVFDRERGKGRAFINGRPHFRGDYVVMLDADGTYAPDAIPRVLGLLAWGDADVVMGDRTPLKGAMTGSHKIGNALLSAMAKILYTKHCPDLCTGLWGFTGEALAGMPLRSHRFELEAELFALAARQRLRISHVPVDYLPRTGAAKLSTSDALRIGWWLMRSRVVDLKYGPAEPESKLVRQVVTTPEASG